MWRGWGGCQTHTRCLGSSCQKRQIRGLSGFSKVTPISSAQTGGLCPDGPDALTSHTHAHMQLAGSPRPSQMPAGPHLGEGAPGGHSRRPRGGQRARAKQAAAVPVGVGLRLEAPEQSGKTGRPCAHWARREVVLRENHTNYESSSDLLAIDPRPGCPAFTYFNPHSPSQGRHSPSPSTDVRTGSQSHVPESTEL